MNLLICALSFILIGMNALFVLLEYALIKVRPSRIEMLVQEGDLRAAAVQRIHAHLNVYIAAIQASLALIALALGWLAEPALAHVLSGNLGGVIPHRALLGLSFALALAALAWAQCVFGEIVPRAVGLQKAEAIALKGAAPLEFFAALARLPTAFVSLCAAGVLKLLGFETAAAVDSPFSQEEVRIVIGESKHGQEPLPLERLLLIENLFDFGKATAREVMVPLEKIASLSLAWPWAENLETIRKSGFSRYPLRRDDAGEIMGMVHVKDILFKTPPGQEPDLLAFKRDVEYVGETELLEDLLRRFSKKGVHMAIVVAAPTHSQMDRDTAGFQPGRQRREQDGKVIGLLTLEDILEELIGEVRDEFDRPEAWSLKDAFVSSAVLVGLAAHDRSSAIHALVQSLERAHPELKAQDVWSAVWERESKFSTSIGHGIAVPHGRLAHLDRPLVAVGRLLKPVAYPSPDAVPVRLLFLVLTPTSIPTLQLKVLSRIATLVSNENLRRRLLRAKTAEALLDILRTADSVLAS